MGNMTVRGRELARADDESDSVLTWDGARFGSKHPGVVNFLFGDGAVRGLSLTTPANILASLGTVNDGNASSF
jgi:prepilin-type processing-associated H-X9-DG protein